MTDHPRLPDGETTAVCAHEECQWEPLRDKADYPWVCVSCRARIDPPENALLVYPDVIERLQADHDALARDLEAAQVERDRLQLQVGWLKRGKDDTEHALTAAQEREGRLRAAVYGTPCTCRPYHADEETEKKSYKVCGACHVRHNIAAVDHAQALRDTEATPPQG